MSRFSLEKLSDATEKFRRGIFLCCVYKHSGNKKFIYKREGESIKNFHRKFFVSQCRKFP